MSHNHCECSHDLKYCAHCHVVWCAKCSREWGEKHAHCTYPSWWWITVSDYPTISSGTDSDLTRQTCTVQDSDSITVSVHDHTVYNTV